MKLWKLDDVHDNNGDSAWVDLVMVVTTMIMMMMMMMKILIDGHKPGDNVDLAESRDVNCVSKIDDNAGGHYNGDTTTVHVAMVMSKILMMLIKAIIISSTLVMMETAIIIMLMSVMTKMMVTTIATWTIEWLGQGNEGTLPCSPPPFELFALASNIVRP